MKYFPYDNKDTQEKAMAIDATSILDTMSDLEEYTGTDKDKIYDIYYEIKRQLKQIAEAEIPKQEPKEEPKEETEK